MEKETTRSAFFFRNLLKGLVWLAIIVLLFVLAKHNVNQDLLQRFEPVFNRSGLIILFYGLSEFLIGIIPPELFMIWSLRSGVLHDYILWVVLLTVISYCAGLGAYFFGRYLHNTRLYNYLRNRYLQKTEILLQEYGLYLILVASLTPLPFSGVAMLVGAVHYPARNYIYLSLARFIKFAVSGYVIWEANML